MKNSRVIACLSLWLCMNISASDGQADLVYIHTENGYKYKVQNEYGETIASSFNLQRILDQYPQGRNQLKLVALQQVGHIGEQRYLIGQLGRLNNRLVTLLELSRENTQDAIKQVHEMKKVAERAVNIGEIIENKLVYYERTINVVKRMLEVGILVGLYATYTGYQL